MVGTHEEQIKILEGRLVAVKAKLRRIERMLKWLLHKNSSKKREEGSNCHRSRHGTSSSSSKKKKSLPFSENKGSNASFFGNLAITPEREEEQPQSSAEMKFEEGCFRIVDEFNSWEKEAISRSAGNNSNEYKDLEGSSMQGNIIQRKLGELPCSTIKPKNRSPQMAIIKLSHQRNSKIKSAGKLNVKCAVLEVQCDDNKWLHPFHCRNELQRMICGLPSQLQFTNWSQSELFQFQEVWVRNSCWVYNVNVLSSGFVFDRGVMAAGFKVFNSKEVAQSEKRRVQQLVLRNFCRSS